MNYLRVLIAIAVVSLAAYCGGPATGAPGSDQSVAAKEAIQKGALIVDVRSASEFAEGHYPGAVNVPVEEVERRLAEFGADKNRTIVVYCRSGRRSGMAQQILQKNGYAHVLNGVNQATLH